jgi:hypothetical protein
MIILQVDIDGIGPVILSRPYISFHGEKESKALYGSIHSPSVIDWCKKSHA